MKLRKKMLISYTILDIYNEYVAPRAGAWIETLHYNCRHAAHGVAPRAGAWIETLMRAEKSTIETSPLAQGRGLKHIRWRGKGFAASSRPPRRGVD